MIKISCIIPAYNEGTRIADVLRVVSGHALVDEIIVIDDGSVDDTRDVVGAFKNVRLIVHEKNKGKSVAVHTGISASAGEFIFLLDADLVGLTKENISHLLESVLEGHADVSMSLRGNAPKIWRMIGLDYISGERVFPKKMLEGHLNRILSLPGFGLEVFLNRLIIKNRFRIAVVEWNNVDSPYKHTKYGRWKGLKGDVKMMRDIFRTVTPLGPFWQIARMLRLRVGWGIHRKKHKISIVIPAHNEEECIAVCLRSVQEELVGGGYNAEVIVVNNASTDRTREIALSFSGVRVVDEPVKGLVRARHAGFCASRGDLIANIDADTRMPAGWLDRVAREFHARENIVALSGPFIYHDLPGHARALVKTFYAAGFLVHIMNHFVFRTGAMLQGGNFVVRRSALDAIGGYDTSIAFYGEDTDVARRISKVGRVKWTFRLPMYTSGRRLKREGMVATGIRYSLNHIWIIFRKKPFTYAHRDIRETHP